MSSGISPAAFEALQHQHQRLRAADREGGQQHRAAAPQRGADDGAQRLLRIFRRVRSVAVGRFDQQHVGMRDALRRGHQQVAVAAEVAGETSVASWWRSVTAQAPSRWPTGVSSASTLPMRAVFAGRQRRELGDRALGVGHRVERQRRRVAREAEAVGAPRVFLLQVRAVEQQHLGEITRRLRAMDGPLEVPL